METAIRLYISITNALPNWNIVSLSLVGQNRKSGVVLICELLPYPDSLLVTNPKPIINIAVTSNETL